MTPKLLKWVLSCCLFFMWIQPSMAATMEDVSLFKVKAVTEHETMYWEYQAPATYKYRSSNIADYNSIEEKEEVTQLFNQLSLQQGMSKEDIVSAFQEEFPHSLQRLEVKWKQLGDELYIWLWEKD